MNLSVKQRAFIATAGVALIVWTILEVTPLGDKMREIGSKIFTSIKGEELTEPSISE